MGCCSSSLVDQDSTSPSSLHHDTIPTEPIVNNNPTSVPLPGAYYTKSRPFKRTGLLWTSDIPLNTTGWEQKKYTFWETAPNFGGRLEVWQALHMAFSEADIMLARSILEAANVILPTGNPCEGCFDELGNAYEIPVFCLVPPVNLTLDSGGQENVTKNEPMEEPMATQSVYSSLDQLVPAPDCSLNPFSIVVRLSTEKDVQLTISSVNETVGSLRTRLFDLSDLKISKETHILRLVYLGRLLRDTMSIECSQDAVDSEQTFANPSSFVIEKDSVIQALIVIKRSN